VSDEPTGFLYPFIDAEETDAGALLVDLAASARAKFAESHRLQAVTTSAMDGELDAAAGAMAQRFAAGGRLYTFGNGGSATDARMAAELFRATLPARSLVDDQAIVTALANDVGFELVFSRQLIAHAQPGDIAMGFSTSGSSTNVLRAMGEARRRGVLTIGLAGYGGGAMAASGQLDHCLVVESDSVHRVQEAQAALVRELRDRVVQQKEGTSHGRGT
jgi:D-sedoheptulose 7-phosphate isomerase